MKAKKIMALLLASTMLLSMGLVGCGENQKESGNDTATNTNDADQGEESVEGTEIYVAAFKGAYGDAFWPEIVSGFEELYKDKGYKVNVVTNEKIEDIVTPQLRNGEGPDVMYLGTNSPSGFAQKLVASGSILNITELLNEKIPGEEVTLKEKMLDGFLDTTATMPYADGDTFMLPLFYSTNGLFYNKALFNEAGTDGKYKLPATWDEFLELGEKAKADNRKLFIYPKAGYLDQFLMAEVASAAGTEKLNEWLKYEDVYSDANFAKVFENLSKLQPYFAWDIFDPAKPIDNEAKILNGDVLFVPCGSWLPGELEEYEKSSDFEYGFMAPPAFEANGERYCAGMIEQIYALNTGDKAKQEVSKAFMSYLYSDKAAEVIAKEGKAVVPIKGGLDIAKAAGFDDTTLELYGVYDKGVKFVSGAFVAANADGVNWKQTYCFSMDSIMQGLDGCDAKWWLDRMKTDAELLKAGIQQQ